MRKTIPMKEAVDNILTICDHYMIDIIQYKENDIPDGKQDSGHHFTIKRNQSFNFEGDNPGLIIYYRPWIRGTEELSVEGFRNHLNYGKRICDCVDELNEYLKDKLVLEEE